MLQPNELRLGNIISYGGQPNVVRWIKNNQIGIIKKNLQPIVISTQDVVGIKLTVKILQDLKLIYDIDGFWHLTDDILLRESEITSLAGYQPYAFNLIDEVNSFGRKLFYLHDLQNFYSSVKGEELIITNI